MKGGDLCLIGLAVTLAVSAPASAQSTDGQPASAPVETTVMVDGRLTRDETTPGADSGLVVGGIPVSAAEAARRQAVVSRETQSLKVDRDRSRPVSGSAETVVSVRDAVISREPGAGPACIQIGVIGAPADCQRPKP
ncbi:hypothetical protein AS593_19720 [Caulobacter vibrioides]|nr:hypothetical protein AS593_19720 [Caulobacter vibrioides]